ncbi:hypothetical protein QE152_g34375 [Popillia japonica]|uniref:Uncharacterized protein n=1 Tax=Popillia japonica TaxID=7064 RepID=A0AAW1ITA9_POPJA
MPIHMSLRNNYDWVNGVKSAREVLRINWTTNELQGNNYDWVNGVKSAREVLRINWTTNELQARGRVVKVKTHVFMYFYEVNGQKETPCNYVNVQ